MYFASCPFAADPGRAQHVLGADVARDVLLQLYAEDECAVVPARLEVGHRGEDRQRSRRTRALVATRRDTPELVDGRRGHRSEVPLPGVDLPECIGDMDHPDLLGRDPPGLQRRRGDLGGQGAQVPALLGEISREVRLISADDPHGSGIHEAPLSTASRPAWVQLQLTEHMTCLWIRSWRRRQSPQRDRG